MGRITKNLTGFERVEAEKKDAERKGKIRPCLEFREMKSRHRRITREKNKKDREHRKRQDEETQQETLEDI